MKFLLLILTPLLLSNKPQFHKNPGCPMNSICSKAMGLKNRQWQALRDSLKKDFKDQTKALKQFQKKVGVPFKLWAMAQRDEIPDMIKWDSPCKNHQGNSKIYQGHIFAKNLKNISPHFIIEQALVLKGDKVISYPIPLKEHPLYLEGENLTFSLYYEGIYYYLATSPNGDLFHPENYFQDVPLRSVKCPDLLVNHFRQKNKNHFYTTYLCYQIKEVKQNTSFPILVGISCL
jgi:hypothetical protein